MKQTKTTKSNTSYKKTKNPELVQKQRQAIITYYINIRKEKDIKK